jgi:cytochrome c
MHTQALLRNVAIVFALVVIGGLLGGAYLVTTGLSARPEPGTLETVVARAVRGFVIRAHAGATSNPIPNSDAVIAEGREHFADHCAVCHANDGSGNTEMGRGLYPKAPDMRLSATQSVHLRGYGRLFRGISSESRETVVMNGRLRDSRPAIRLRQGYVLIGLGGVALRQRQEVLL